MHFTILVHWTQPTGLSGQGERVWRGAMSLPVQPLPGTSIQLRGHLLGVAIGAEIEIDPMELRLHLQAGIPSSAGETAVAEIFMREAGFVEEAQRPPIIRIARPGNLPPIRD
jgi:hypothetical protein